MMWIAWETFTLLILFITRDSNPGTLLWKIQVSKGVILGCRCQNAQTKDCLSLGCLTCLLERFSQCRRRFSVMFFEHAAEDLIVGKTVSFENVSDGIMGRDEL